MNAVNAPKPERRDFHPSTAAPPPATLTRSRGQPSGQKVTARRSVQALHTALISSAGHSAPLIKLIEAVVVVGGSSLATRWGLEAGLWAASH